MNQTLASEALDWLIEPSGDCDRTRLFTILNQCRERFYQLYDDVPLFEISECFELQTFCNDCDQCQDSYRGITLPRDYQTVEALWFNDWPIVLNSSWREWQMGMAPIRTCSLQKYDMAGLYSSERDILPRARVALFVRAFVAADVGKVVTIRGVDAFGVAQVETVKLDLEPTYTKNQFRSIDRGSGFAKPRTAGAVAFGCDGGRVLSVYGPDETMPGYRRIKITGLHQGCEQVNVRGARRYFPVFRETDVVELDNRTAFEEMARFLRYNRMVSKTGADIQAASFAFAQAKQALLGDKAREIGKSTQSQLRVETIGCGPARIGGW